MIFFQICNSINIAGKWDLLDAQLQEDNVDARAVGDKPIVVTFAQSGRRYEVDGGGNVTGIGGNAVTSGIEGLTLSYQLGDNIYIYP